MTRTFRTPALVAALALALLGCKPAKSKLDEINAKHPMPKAAMSIGAAKPTTAATAEPAADLDSKDILGRSETSPAVFVKHVLIGWKDLAASYRGQMDPRAAGRSSADAAKLATEVLGKLRSNPGGVDALVKELSEDPGSQSGEPYEVKPETQFVPEFKQLALRLQPNEAGIVKTSYGYHVMIRVAAPKPDALESTDIMSRATAETGTVQVQHVLIGWKGAPGARTATRTKEEADKLATDVLAKVKAGGDMAALMKEFSEDPGSKGNGRIYDVTPDAPMVEPFKTLSLRLQMGEAGLVKSPFGWHVIKRVPPPAPDVLESADILKREPVTKSSKVKHVLLGWAETNSGDERAKKRDRAALEKLVKDTVAKIQKGAKIEALMAELSEDPGSAKSGEGYDVTPDAGLVPPFKNLGLRLNPGEVGVVKSEFGIHIIQRVDGMPGAAPEKAPPAPAGVTTAPAPAKPAPAKPAPAKPAPAPATPPPAAAPAAPATP